MEYTKQEVQEFLGSKATDNTRLIRQLATKGITATTNGKRGANLRFECDKPLEVELSEFEKFVEQNMPNFKTKRPQLAEHIWEFFTAVEGQFEGSFQLMANEINKMFDTTYDRRHVNEVYNDFVATGQAKSTKDAKTDYEYTYMICGVAATAEQVEKYKELMATKRAELLEQYPDMGEGKASREAYFAVRAILGSATPVKVATKTVSAFEGTFTLGVKKGSFKY